MRAARLVNSRNAFLIIVVALAAFVFQDSRGLFETTEGRYAECAREMLETGDWLVPQLNYEPHWTKPPLTYWLIAASMKVFGRNEFAVRFPSALAMFLTTLAVWKLGIAMWDSSKGYVSALVYGTCLLPVAAANSVSADAPLALWEMLVVLAYWLATLARDGAAQRRYVLVVWLCCGLAFLTKGPPGLLALLCVLAYHWYARRKGRSAPRIASAAGIAVCVVVGLSWYLLVAMKHPELVSYFLKDEVYGRILTDKFRRNAQWYGPLAAYVPPLVLGALPWLVIWVTLAVRRGVRPAEVPRSGRIKSHVVSAGEIKSPFTDVSLEPDPAKRKTGFRLSRRDFLRRLVGDDRLLFLVIWLCLPLLILSISKSRLPFYVLPLFPAVALLLGRGIAGILGAADVLRRVRTLGLVSCVLVVALKWVAGIIPVSSDMRPLYEACRTYDDGNTSFVVCTEKDMFGLQFYMDGRLDRASGLGGETPNAGRSGAGGREPVTGAQRPSGGGVDGFIDHMAHSAKWGRYVLIAKAGDRSIRAQLTDAGLKFEEVSHSKAYKLYVLFVGEESDPG